MNNHVQILSDGIVELGLHGPIDIDGKDWRMVAMYSEHRLAWTMIELAAARQNITIAPLYDTSKPDFVQSILRQTQVTTVFASAPNAAKLMKIMKESPEGINLKQIVVIGDDADRIKLLVDFPNMRIPLILLAEVKQTGGLYHSTKLTPPRPEDVNTICFTSGTTGDPKGVLITHRMLLSVVGAATKLDIGLSRNDVYLAFLPPAHILERFIDLVLMYNGARIGYYSGDRTKLARDLALVAPTVLAGVPRSLEKTIEKIEMKIATKSKPFKTLIARALAESDTVMNDLNRRDSSLSLASSIFIRGIRKPLGGRLRLIISGGGPLAPRTQAKLKQYLHVYAIQGYGLTETTGGTLAQSPRSRTYGIVGIPFPCVEITLADKEIHKEITPGAGEILVRGPSVFSGYFRRPELSAEVFTQDGWFRTGDIAVVVEDEFGEPQFKIVGRTKEIFKLSNGEYVVPAILEGHFRGSPAVEEVFVDLAPSKNEGLVALVKLNEAYLNDYLSSTRNDHLAQSLDDKILNSDTLGLRKEVLASFRIIAEHAKLSHVEQISDVVMTTINFGLESEYQTVTGKAKRALLRGLLVAKVEELGIGKQAK
jgi:long-chain acyl-CoA synthetase